MIEEILDVVDEQDLVIGQLSREEIYKRKLHNYRVIHGLMINKQGKIWIPKRVATKKFWPNSLDYSVGGHVESGETYEKTLYREALEELNINLNDVSWRELGKLMPGRDGVFCVQMNYEIQSDQTPAYNHEDFFGAEWLFPQEILDMIKKGEPEVCDLAFTIRKFYL